MWSTAATVVDLWKRDTTGCDEVPGMDADLSRLSMVAVPGGCQVHDMLLLLGAILITAALLLRYRNRYRQELTAQERVERSRQLHGLRGDLEQLMVEVEQLAKRFAT